MNCLFLLLLLCCCGNMGNCSRRMNDGYRGSDYSSARCGCNDNDGYERSDRRGKDCERDYENERDRECPCKDDRVTYERNDYQRREDDDHRTDSLLRTFPRFSEREDCDCDD